MSTSSTFPARRGCKADRSSSIPPTMSLSGLAWTTSPTTCERRGAPGSKRGQSVPRGGVALRRNEEDGDRGGRLSGDGDYCTIHLCQRKYCRRRHGLSKQAGVSL